MDTLTPVTPVSTEASAKYSFAFSYSTDKEVVLAIGYEFIVNVELHEARAVVQAQVFA